MRILLAPLLKSSNPAVLKKLSPLIRCGMTTRTRTPLTADQEALPSVRLLEGSSDNLIHWEDRSEMDSLFGLLSDITGKPMLHIPVG